MKLILFSGFLGAGKTSCIRSFSNYLYEEQHEGIKLAVIENEVAGIGVDDQFLSQTGLEVRTLSAGCICCTLTADLITTLRQLKQDFHPDYVIFEPSGIAYPKRILENLTAYSTDIDRHIQITVVDAQRWHKIQRVAPELLAGQVRTADALLLNKCDLTDGAQLEAVTQELRVLNPTANIWKINGARGIASVIWEDILT